MSKEHDKDWFLSVDWDKVTSQHTDYILSEAKGALRTSLTSSDSLDKKSFIILTGCAGYISILLPFVFNSNSVDFIIPSIILVVGALAALLTLIWGIKTRVYFTEHNNPKNTLTSESMREPYKRFLFWEIVSCHVWNEHNEELNTHKGKLINISLFILAITFVIAIVIYVIISYCSS